MKRKTLTIALFRARQKVRRERAVFRCKEAVQIGAPSRLEGPPPRTRAPVLEKLENWGPRKNEQLQGRIEIVHRHFLRALHRYYCRFSIDWIEKSWPGETLEVLPMIDAERVREVTWAFRKRTSCADDHMVIEMLTELDMDV